MRRSADRIGRFRGHMIVAFSTWRHLANRESLGIASGCWMRVMIVVTLVLLLTRSLSRG